VFLVTAKGAGFGVPSATAERREKDFFDKSLAAGRDRSRAITEALWGATVSGVSELPGHS
jgi:hypothetical protein